MKNYFLFITSCPPAFSWKSILDRCEGVVLSAVGYQEGADTVPIYEYEAVDVRKACSRCRKRFEVIQGINEPPLQRCPSCGQGVRKVISWCRGAVVETSEEHAKVEHQITEYERQGMWSHAAELADKHSEKIKDKDLKIRALEDYEKAGYDAKSLEGYVNSSQEASED